MTCRLTARTAVAPRARRRSADITVTRARVHRVSSAGGRPLSAARRLIAACGDRPACGAPRWSGPAPPPGPATESTAAASGGAIPSRVRASASSRAGRLSVASSSFSRSLSRRSVRFSASSEESLYAASTTWLREATWRMPTAASSPQQSKTGRNWDSTCPSDTRRSRPPCASCHLLHRPEPRAAGPGVALLLCLGGLDRAAGEHPERLPWAPQAQTGSPGGQVQRPSSVRKASFTRRSSRLWKAITAALPPVLSSRAARRGPASSSPSSSFTAIRSAWKVRVATWMRFGQAFRGTARFTASTAARVVVGQGGLEARGRWAGRRAPRPGCAAPPPARRRRAGRSARPRSRPRPHPHVQGAVGLEGEAALRRVELGAADPEVEQHAVDREQPQRAEERLQLRGPPLHGPEAGTGAEPGPRRGHRPGSRSTPMTSAPRSSRASACPPPPSVASTSRLPAAGFKRLTTSSRRTVAWTNCTDRPHAA